MFKAVITYHFHLGDDDHDTVVVLNETMEEITRYLNNLVSTKLFEFTLIMVTILPV